MFYTQYNLFNSNNYYSPKKYISIMTTIKLCKCRSNAPFLTNYSTRKTSLNTTSFVQCKNVKFRVRACASSGENKTERRNFLTLEEAGLVEFSGLSTHERFLCRLTISSLNLLRVISEQEGCSIEELNAGRVTDWFVKDKLKREQNLDSAVLQWDDSEFQF